MTEWKPEASIRWLSSPPEGVPRLTVGSQSFAALPLSLEGDDMHPLATTPGELFAGAIGAVFALLVAEELLAAGTQARELTTHVTMFASGDTADRVDGKVRSVTCRLLGRVPNIDQAGLEVAARTAMLRCIEALGMTAGGIAFATEAVLEGA